MCLSIYNLILCLQDGGYTLANMVWDMMQARKITPSLPACQAYYNGLKVNLVSFKLSDVNVH